MTNTARENPSKRKSRNTAAVEATQAIVTLSNGDILRGDLVSDGDPVVINHPVLGQLSFNRANVVSVRTMKVEEAAEATTAALQGVTLPGCDGRPIDGLRVG